MASDNVVNFPGITKLNLPPERILEQAAGADLDGVVVIGWTKAGKFFAASSYPDGGDVMFLCEMVKHRLIEIVNEEAADK